MAVEISEFIAAILGGAVAIVGQAAVHYFKEGPNRKLDKKRKEQLKKMLAPANMPAGKEWRLLSTLSRVIGASEEETKRLLIEIDARGSETNADVWALIKHQPLPTRDKED